MVWHRRLSDTILGQDQQVSFRFLQYGMGLAVFYGALMLGWLVLNLKMPLIDIISNSSVVYTLLVSAEVAIVLIVPIMIAALNGYRGGGILVSVLSSSFPIYPFVFLFTKSSAPLGFETTVATAGFQALIVTGIYGIFFGLFGFSFGASLSSFAQHSEQTYDLTYTKSIILIWMLVSFSFMVSIVYLVSSQISGGSGGELFFGSSVLVVGILTTILLIKLD